LSELFEAIINLVSDQLPLQRGYWFFFFTFCLDTKSNKKVKAIRCGKVFYYTFSYDESPVGKVI